MPKKQPNKQIRAHLEQSFEREVAKIEVPIDPRTQNLRRMFDARLEAQLANIPREGRMDYISNYIVKLPESLQKQYRNFYPEYFPQANPLSPYEQEAKAVYELALKQAEENDALRKTRVKILQGQGVTFESSNSPSLKMFHEETIVRKRVLEDDLHDPRTAIVSYLKERTDTDDMYPIGSTIVFRVSENTLNLSQLSVTKINHPFTDYTLVYNNLNDEGSDQFDCIRVYKDHNKWVMAVFSVDRYGDYAFRFSVPLEEFKWINCFPDVNINSIKLDKKYMKTKPTPEDVYAVKDYLFKLVLKKFVQLMSFLCDYSNHQVKINMMPGAINQPNNPRQPVNEVVAKYVEYVLDISKPTNKYSSGKKQGKYVKGDPKTKEYTRIGHWRHLKNGKRCWVSGSTCNKDSPLGKVVKDYKV